MSDLTQEEIATLDDLMSSIAPNLALALSEQFNKEITLGAPEVSMAPVSELLSSQELGQPIEVFQTVFSLSPPLTTESIFMISDEVGRHLITLLGGDPGEVGEPVGEPQMESMSAALGEVARGVATALSNIGANIIELESNSTTFGPISLPPVFAMFENAVRVDLDMAIPEGPAGAFTLLYTPEAARLLIPAANPAGADSSGFGGAGDVIGEDELAAMLSGLGGDAVSVGAGGGLASGGSPGGGLPGAGLPGGADPFGGAMPAGGPFTPFTQGGGEFIPRGIELIMDIPLEVTVELGRVRMLIKDVLELSSGSIVELDRVAGEPVDLLVNGRLVAKGEVVVIEDNFGIRITEIISPADRLVSLGKNR